MSNSSLFPQTGHMIGDLLLSNFISQDLIPAEPLWQRAPTHDSEGNLLSDFMMLIPKLRQRPHDQINQTLRRLQAALDLYKNTVVFVDLNLRLNVLWVSVKPVPGICLDLPTTIKSYVPEALLVAQGPQQQ
jgi:hypothetical protein